MLGSRVIEQHFENIECICIHVQKYRRSERVAELGWQIESAYKDEKIAIAQTTQQHEH